MFDLEKLIQAQRELQLSFAGGVNSLSFDGFTFKAVSGCSPSCAGSCSGSCSDSCYGTKMPGSCTYR